MPNQPKTEWLIPPTLSKEVDKALNSYPEIFRQILFNRGIDTAQAAESFLAADEPMHDPFLLKDFEKAVDLIFSTIEEKKKIIIFGDYDVDGVTASALLLQVLKKYEAIVEVFIPNRFDQGYGLSMDALEEVLVKKPGLLISVDCGVRSVKEVELARKSDIDVIITDHHQPHAVIPEANAIVCPRQPNDTYPFKELSGVGIAYKVAQGLLQKYPVEGVNAENWIDLVAVGTIADLARLEGENRVLVRKGLRSIRFGRRPGLLALANVSGFNISEIKAEDIGFRIGPRLNAAGRLGSAEAAFNILIAETTEEAGNLALQLDKENKKRQDITLEIQTQIENRHISEENDWILFYWDEKFNEGVVGLAASKLTDRYYRPSIIGVQKGNLVRASCRSIPEINITNVLDECEDLLLQHGGHAMAAGLTIKLNNIEEFSKRITKICKRELEGEPLFRKKKAELEVNLVDMRPDLIEYIDSLSPMGIGNPTPLFIARKVKSVQTRKIGTNGDHLKMTVSDGKITFDAIAFRFGSSYDLIRSEQPIDILFSYDLHSYHGRKSLQLNVRDIKICDESTITNQN
jgi:single-stranded-DNA-specific exonuclease